MPILYSVPCLILYHKCKYSHAHMHVNANTVVYVGTPALCYAISANMHTYSYTHVHICKCKDIQWFTCAHICTHSVALLFPSGFSWEQFRFLPRPIRTLTMLPLSTPKLPLSRTHTQQYPWVLSHVPAECRQEMGFNLTQNSVCCGEQGDHSSLFPFPAPLRSIQKLTVLTACGSLALCSVFLNSKAEPNPGGSRVLLVYGVSLTGHPCFSDRYRRPGTLSP